MCLCETDSVRARESVRKCTCEEEMALGVRVVVRPPRSVAATAGQVLLWWR